MEGLKDGVMSAEFEIAGASDRTASVESIGVPQCKER